MHVAHRSPRPAPRTARWRRQTGGISVEWLAVAALVVALLAAVASIGPSVSASFQTSACRVIGTVTGGDGGGCGVPDDADVAADDPAITTDGAPATPDDGTGGTTPPASGDTERPDGDATGPAAPDGGDDASSASEEVDPETAAAAAEALEDITGLLDGGWFGPSLGDIDDALDLIASLPPDVAAQVLAGLSDDDLRQLIGHHRALGFLPWGDADHHTQLDRLSILLGGADETQAARILAMAGDLTRPSFGDVDSFEEDAPWLPEDLVWREFEDAELFAGDPSLADINQGALGDCYLLAAFGALAQSDPGAIEDMITDNGNGTYTVRMYDPSGDPIGITVDAAVPVYDEHGQPSFAGLGDPPRLWVNVLEQAAALYEEGYGGIGDGGWPEEAWGLVTGTAGERLDAADTDAGQLQAILDDGGMVVGATQSNSQGMMLTDTNGDEVPVFQPHAYVVTAFEDDGAALVANPHDASAPPIRVEADQFEEIFPLISTGDLP
jgi:hypothetical protein